MRRHSMEAYEVARFLHLTDARLAERIRRNGLRAPSGRRGDGFVYCVPVTPDFFGTFQWGRELRRGGYRSSVAVVLVVPDSEAVLVGRFGASGETMTAAEAVAHFSDAAGTLGHQVRIRRKIEPREIRSIHPAPSLVGWRFYPEAKGQQVFWPSPGTIKARRIRARVDARYG